MSGINQLQQFFVPLRRLVAENSLAGYFIEPPLYIYKGAS